LFDRETSVRIVCSASAVMDMDLASWSSVTLVYT
jgi:hypothetical protein